MSYREKQIREVEESINKINASIELRERELEAMWAERDEMREVLQLLRAGKITKPADPKPARRRNKPHSKLSTPMVRDAALKLRTFTRAQLVEELGCSKNAPNPYMDELMERGILTVDAPTRRGVAAVYHYTHPRERAS